MVKPIRFRACLLLVLCLVFPCETTASDEQAWWAAAAREAEQEGYRLIDTASLAEVLDSDADALIVDVRADYEHEAGCIPDAENLEFDLGDRTALTPEKQAALEALLGPDKARRVVIYCRSFR